MLDRYDPTELLDLIEGDLDAGASEDLRARLAHDPPARAIVESMMRDRASLRSLEHPALPQDFITAMEPMLSRPMLIEPVSDLATLKPGEFRRQYRRRTRHVRIGRLAAAAAVFLAVAGGTWALIVNWSSLRGSSGGGNAVAANNSNQGSSLIESGSAANRRGAHSRVASGVPGPGVVHHDLRPQPDRDAIASRSNTDDSSAHIAPGAPGQAADRVVLAADFAVVMQSPSESAAEFTVRGALADLGDRAALVRNFSFEEAQRLSEEYRIAHGGSREATTGGSADQPRAAVAPGTGGLRDHALTSAEMQQLATQVREQLRLKHAAAAATDATEDSGLLAGASDLAPTLEQQLEFSSRGVSHTVAVQVSELVPLIERLALSDPAAGVTTLRVLPKAPMSDEPVIGSGQELPSTTAPVLAWLTEGPLVRQALQRLSAARSDAIVLLPVIVR